MTSAWWVMSPARADPAELRAALAERLPAYMVPAAVVVIDALPLTVNGKLDTRALPAPEYTDVIGIAPRATGSRRSWPASTPRCSVLERVGVDDSFFELGGDSILSMQVVARARAAGVLCRPRDIFVEQTVAGLARVAGVADGAVGVVDEGVGSGGGDPDHVLAGGRGGPSGAVQPDGAGAGPGRGESRPTWWWCCRPCWIGMPCCGCESDSDGAGGWSLTVPEAGSVDAARVPAVGGRVVRGGGGGGAVAVEPGRRGDAQRVVGGLARVSWCSIVHHLAVDGVSWRIVLEDLNIAWAQHRGGQPVVLPVAGTSFARWASLLARARAPPGGRRAGGAVAAGGGDPGRAAGGAPGGGYAMQTPGSCRCRWISRPPACCSVRCRRRFMPGCTTSC